MLGVEYFRAEPNQYARISVNGHEKKSGRGISAFFLPYRSSIEVISLTTVDQPFVFNEISDDRQEITLQGGFLYSIMDPAKTLKLYNFAINPKSKLYLSEDSTKLPEHILQLVRADSRDLIQKMKLEQLLVMTDDLSNQVFDSVRKLDAITCRGVNLEMIYFSSLRPTSEITKALGAQYREKVLQDADKASYERRAAAVDQEKQIKDNELKNKIFLENKRTELIGLEGANLKTEAQHKTDAAKLEMSVFDNLSAEEIRAHALYQLGKNAARIQTLTITPEILAGLKQ